MGLASLFLALLALSCGPSPSEVLATFNGGRVSRSEMRRLMVLALGPDARDKASVELQTAKLRQIALMKIVALEFQKEGPPKDFLTKKEKLKHLYDLEAQQLSYSYELKQDAQDFGIPLVELQFLFLRQDTGAPSREDEARAYLEQLNSAKKQMTSAEIEDFIQKKSEHGRYKWIGGYVEPFCLICDSRSPLLGIPSSEIEKILEKSDAKFVLLSRPGGYLILRKIASEEIALEDLEDYQLRYFRKTMRLANHYAQHAPPPEKAAARRAAIAQNDEQLERANYQIAQRAKDQYLQAITRIRVEKLRRRLHFEWKLKDPQSYASLLKPDAPDDLVLFSIQSKPYTKKDLDSDLKNLGLAEESPASLSSIINGILIPYKLLMHDPDFRDSKATENFQFFRKLIELREANKAYFARLPEPRISEKEIRDFYKKQKGINKPLTKELKKQIKGFLLNKARNKQAQTRSQELAASYQLTIKTKLLKPNVL